MITFLTVNIIAVLLAAMAIKGGVKWMYFSQLLLTFVYSIRYEVGNDYPHYYWIFEKMKLGYNPEVTEPGWFLLNYLSQPIGFFGLVFIVTCFEYYAVYRFIRIYVPQKFWWLAVAIFTLTFNFQLLGLSMMRQFLAMVILLYSVKYIVERKFIYFLLILAAAMSIHQTALIFLPVYFLGGWNPNLRSWKWILTVVGGFILLLVVSSKYVEYFELAAVIFDNDKYYHYMMWDAGSYSFTIIFDILWLILMMRLCPQDRTHKVIVMISIVAYFLLPFTFLVVILLRLMLFFSFFFIISLPKMFESVRPKLIQGALIAIYIFLMLKRSLATLGGETYGEFYDTYQTIFSANTWL